MRGRRRWRFAKDVFLPDAFHFHVHRHAGRGFGDMVVQKRHPPLDGVRHLHPIGEIVQNEIRQHRLGIHIEHLIQPVAAGDALRQRQTIQRGHQRLKLPNRRREIITEQRGHAVGLGRTYIERGGQPAQPALHCGHLRAVDLLGHQQRARRGIGAQHLIEERRLLAGTQRRIVIERVDPEVRIAAQHFVGAFADEHHLDARGSHGTAEQILGHAVAVEHLRLGMPDRIGERVGDLAPGDRDGVIRRADMLGLSLRDAGFVIERVLKGERKRADRPIHLLLRKPEDGADEGVGRQLL